MGERLQRLNFVLNTIPQYDGNANTLSTFINAVSLVNELLEKFNPPLDDFEVATAFLAVRNKIIGKALESIKDLYLRNWDDLKVCLLRNFDDKSNSVTLLTEILNVTNIKNPSVFFDIIKGKFNDFKSKICIEEETEEKRNAIMNFVEKLIITHFIINLNDPFRNNLVTRNPKTLNEVERLIRNDLQYLKVNQVQRPTNSNYNNNNHFNKNKPSNYQPRFNTNRPPFQYNKQFNYTPTRNDSFRPQPQTHNNTFKPEPMSVQTRQTRPFTQREMFYGDESFNEAGPSREENITAIENISQNHFLGISPDTSNEKS